MFVEDPPDEPSDNFNQVIGLCFLSSLEEDTWKKRSGFSDQSANWNVYKDITPIGCQHLCSEVHSDTCKSLVYHRELRLCALTHHLWADLVTPEEERLYDCGDKVPIIDIYNRDRNIAGRYNTAVSIWVSRLKSI